MKILICALQFQGGSLQVVLSLINELKKISTHEYYVVMSKEVENQINRIEFSENFVFYSLPYFSRFKLINLIYRAKWLTLLETNIEPDCVLSTSGPVYWKSASPHLMGYNLPANIYPESPFFKNLTLERKIRWRLKRIIHRYYFRQEASAFFVQTDDVNQRLKKYLNSKEVYTISNTYSGYFRDILEYKNKLPNRKEKEIRFLTISSYYPHKNFEIIKPVIKELEKRNMKNIIFVLTIQPEFYSKLFGEQYKGPVINIGPVKLSDCPSLYNECDGMFLPTLLECFSASYAEAMVMHKPIITTDLGFAHTVCGDAALYFDPVNPIDIVDKIELLITDSQIAGTLVQNGNKRLKQFGTAADRAAQIIHLCNKIKKK